MYPGVVVGHIQSRPSGDASVTLQIDHPSVILRLAGCAANANVTFSVVGTNHWKSDEALGAPDQPWYQLSASAFPGAEFQSSELLCGHMVHDLCEHGLFEESEGRRLLESWGWPTE
jgi:hypothetical protein